MMFKLTPREIVKELDRFVVGQYEAKKSVAIALRNRWKRKQLDDRLKEEIMPHNILMVGPTGVGKTEIARRLAKLVNAPFIKIEATKFTEVGYVGRDVDSIIRDLLDVAIKLVKDAMRQEVALKAANVTEAKIIDSLVGVNASEETRNKFHAKLKNGELDTVEIEVTVADNPQSNLNNVFDIPNMPGGQIGLFNIGDMLNKAMGGKKTKNVKVTVAEAYKILLREESEKLIDEEKAIAEAIRLTEEDGIVFLDEIDKIASSRNNEGGGSRGEVSREGVQRDLLPLVEGTVVSTKYGAVKTNHILFIASGAFHLSKPSDLLAELQGRFPIRVQLSSLSEADLVRILQETENSIAKQYQAMLNVEEVSISFTDDGIAKIAAIATEINNEIENIGARRLHTIMEKLLEEISFEAPDLKGDKIEINKQFVEQQLNDLTKKQDLMKFLL
ncbi:MAG: ATP-dependent protease ATPase subunit HslU [Candidatus Midichloria mitochondrii]|uniref:ATP-dependent protease HslVU, ATPase subunit HslU n=1 Tax=Midichloria mitochondrii (strain IricVA) TaxID=696127 RepID=F7XUJ5_MIDMI|nr:ATP-dependent protease ATPase subunit HslU [Candidatus Midichloria mitochondrii]AEI88344.1 ATP-dependent protease HslVU, ATPase subunit HslU [Candidatus Midichloria mitochondrii IricVA]MDJ1256273.1 ATP-dependent protease ATPase subunit HslU [Candidatus Midichloria mitochondrii]MDJ1288641.1 ATP-dependent protease ATPase subunit HslU [Candidatus Midichloria mitochondrii]MDJ1298815.1 ATP-dependent protease ATPase subunit HslU [Candidatus Midichloria mitochondrii]MDJ1313021.1 ATP-dependent prot